MRSVVWLRCSILALVIGGGALDEGATGAQPQTTVVVTGDEQQVVEQYVSDWKRPEAGDFANVLDFVHTVLVQRGNPTPDARELRRKAVRAMSRVCSEASSTRPPASKQDLYATWLEQVEKSGSFAAVLRDASWSNKNPRQQGIDAAMQAMLGPTGWLLPQHQAEAIHKMMAARKQGAAEPSRERASFEIKQLQPGVIYLRIPTFEDADIGQRIVKELHKELAAGSNAVLIDLRDNPGGQPEQSNAVADFFLDRRTLQIMRFRDGRLVKFVSRGGASEAAVAVLVNRNTGCGAETLAMALRDNDRAILIGERTAGVLYGKDGVDLPDGRLVLFRCEPTILSPSKADYAVRGIPPHKAIDLNRSNAAVLQEAVEALRASRQNSKRRARQAGDESRP
jgi:hypothetical protein